MREPCTAPESCRTCGHVLLVKLQTGGRVERHDRCNHPSGPHPMHEPCGWHTAKTQEAQEELK